jgi:hypothetical protein
VVEGGVGRSVVEGELAVVCCVEESGGGRFISSVGRGRKAGLCVLRAKRDALEQYGRVWVLSRGVRSGE